VVSGVSQFERGLEAGDAAPTTNVRGSPSRASVPRLLMLDALGRAEISDLAFSVPAPCRVDPGDVLAEIGHLAEVRIQPGALAGVAEGFFVQVRRAGAPQPRRSAPAL